MAFFHQNSITHLGSNFNEDQWVDQIRKILKEELEEGTDIPVTIFGVPKTLKDIHPNSYTPHTVALGPYHHLRPSLYDMERYKVSAARRSQKEFKELDLEHFVDHLMNFEVRIRACYHKPLNYGTEALAWMMTIDACFLFDYFQVSGVKKVRALNKLESRLSNLVDLSGNRIAHNDIIRDITMLENQIPLFVMRMMLEFQFADVDSADEVFLEMLTRLSNDLSPFKVGKYQTKVHLKDCPHILAFLYQFIVPKSEVASQIIDVIEEDLEKEMGSSDSDSSSRPTRLRRVAGKAADILSKAVNVKRLAKLPWVLLTRVPILRKIKGPIENMFNSLSEENGEKDECGNLVPKPPLLEEITIPCVEELFDVGIKFIPTYGSITSITFDEKTLTLSMPTVVLDVNSDVVLRNLVAYEACIASGPLVLTRYTELMNGIIDTERDVEILCKQGIIINHLKSEKEVSDLWNGMSKSIRLTKVPSLDKMIADVNHYYNRRWKVKFKNFMVKYVFGSWKLLTFLGAVLVMLLMGLQAFCQIYTCARFFYVPGLAPDDEDMPTD